MNKARITKWDDLNAELMKADLMTAQAMLVIEMKSKAPRKQFVLRIHSRINKLRAEGERKKLLGSFK